MSLRYKGAVISATPPTTTSGNSGTAPGAWTLQQQMQAQSAGNWPAPPIWYVEDVFSTWLYSGTGATNTQTIANGIDESGKGALTWFKKRSTTSSHLLFDTNRGNNSPLATDSTSGQGSGWSSYFNFLSNGVSVSDDLNVSGTTYASWTFRKQPKFFDIQTYTTNSGTGAFATISHNLGSVPGFILVKATNQVDDWYVYHRSNGSGKYMVLNSTAAVQTDAGFFSSVTSTQVVGLPNYASGTSYVVYLFAHDAGGFGLTGTDNVISCGSYVGNSTSGVSVNLGFEPQWILFKNVTTGGANSGWYIHDNMRGLPAPPSLSITRLKANTSGAEEVSASSSGVPQITATGFNLSPNESTGYNKTGDTYIYIAIRRGPMKTPTSGTSVFDAKTWAGTGTSGGQVRLAASSTVQAPDFAYISSTGIYNKNAVFDRLRNLNSTTGGSGKSLVTSSTDAEGVNSDAYGFFSMDYMNGFAGEEDYWSYSGRNYVNYALRRAPGFFDVVCYTGTGDGTFVARPHNLTVKPELIIIKSRSAAASWPVLFNMGASSFNRSFLNTTGAAASINYSNTDYLSSEPTSTNVLMGAYDDASWNASGATYVMYLFASCPGVSKVGSYTGTASTQTISCGFAARFVMIKRTDVANSWFVWDTARGMVAGTDPRLALNSTAAEVNNNFVYTDASGFQLVTTDASVNANGGTYVYLAIA